MTQDHDQRALLHAADPARALQPLTDTERRRALEAAMTDHDPHRTPDGYATRGAGTRHRNPLTWVVAVAAVLVVAGATWAGVQVISGPQDVVGTAATAPTSTAPTSAAPSAGAGPTADGSVPAGDAVRLGVPGTGDVAARCMVPDARVLQNQELAFEGTLTESTDEGLTFVVDTWFRGGGAATVEVDPVDDRLRQLLVAPDFTEGGSYLVSGSGGTVTLCGFSGEADPPLRALYERAFP